MICAVAFAAVVFGCGHELHVATIQALRPIAAQMGNVNHLIDNTLQECLVSGAQPLEIEITMQKPTEPLCLLRARSWFSTALELGPTKMECKNGVYAQIPFSRQTVYTSPNVYTFTFPSAPVCTSLRFTFEPVVGSLSGGRWGFQEIEVLAGSTPVPDTAAPPTAVPTSSPPTLVPPTPFPQTPSPPTPVPKTPVPATSAPATTAPATPAPATPVPDTPIPPTPAPATPSPLTPVPLTSVPATLAPVTPSPQTPAPATPAPDTPTPPTSAPDTPAPVTPAPATPSPPTPAPGTPTPDTSAPDTPAPDTLTPAFPPTPAPLTQAPATPVPKTPSPQTLAPDTSAPDTPAPLTQAPATSVPVTPSPQTPAPDTPTPAFPPTLAPSTQAPATLVPSTPSPQTLAPDTSAPDTPAPLTQAPATPVPDTSAPDTPAPDTPTPAFPPTPAPSTQAPATSVPVTPSPQTPVPDTSAPDTPAPDTPKPAFPPTSAPSTQAPATSVPVTPSPQTPVPDTSAPDTPAPDTPKPAFPPTSAPSTQAPATSVPVTPSPQTPAPDTPKPAFPPTSAPSTPAPATPIPKTPSPQTPAPKTSAPDTLAPSTLVPDTPSPQTPAPDTPAPAFPPTPAPSTPVPVTPAPDTPTPAFPPTPSPQTLMPSTVAPDTPVPVPVTVSPLDNTTFPPSTPAPDTAVPDVTLTPNVTQAPTAVPSTTPSTQLSSSATTAPTTPAPIAHIDGEAVNSIAKGALASATLLGAGTPGPVMRLVLVTQGCFDHERFPSSLHPTKLHLGSEAGGAVLGNLMLIGSVAIAMQIAKLVVPPLLMTVAPYYRLDREIIGAMTFPAGALFVMQVLFIGLCLGGMVLIVDSQSVIESVFGGLMTMLCIVVPALLFKIVANGVPKSAVYRLDEERIRWKDMLLGPGEWVAVDPASLWVSKYQSLIRCYKQSNAWFNVVDMYATLAAAGCSALQPDTAMGCGHIMMSLTVISVLYLICLCVVRPYIRAYDMILECTALVIKIIGLVLVAAGFYSEDLGHYGFDAGGVLFIISGIVLSVRIVSGLLGEAIVMITNRRKRLQSLNKKPTPTIEISLLGDCEADDVETCISSASETTATTKGRGRSKPLLTVETNQITPCETTVFTPLSEMLCYTPMSEPGFRHTQNGAVFSRRASLFPLTPPPLHPVVSAAVASGTPTPSRIGRPRRTDTAPLGMGRFRYKTTI